MCGDQDFTVLIACLEGGSERFSSCALGRLKLSKSWELTLTQSIHVYDELLNHCLITANLLEKRAFRFPTQSAAGSDPTLEGPG